LLSDVIQLLFALAPAIITIIILGACISIMHFISSIDTSNYDDVEVDVESGNYKIVERSAADILAERYARGELSDEEYTSKMARL